MEQYPFIKKVKIRNSIVEHAMCTECDTYFECVSDIHIRVHLNSIKHINSKTNDQTYIVKCIQNYHNIRTAKPIDYIIKTYVQIKYGERYVGDYRINRVFYKNFEKIRLAATNYLIRFCENQMWMEMNNVKFYSFIVHNTLCSINIPVFLQYFHEKEGIKHWLLRFFVGSIPKNGLYNSYLPNSLVAYCGDYNFLRNSSGETAPHFIELKKHFSHKIHYLPCLDEGIEHLFNITVEYLPRNYISILKQLGELPVSLQDYKNVILKYYNEYLQDDKFILASKYCKKVLKHFQGLNRLFTAIPTDLIPKSILDFFNDEQSEIYLTFLIEIYNKFTSLFEPVNSGVIQYFALVKLRDLVKTYYKTETILPATLKLLNASSQYTSVSREITNFYLKFSCLLEKLFTPFQLFDRFYWLILRNFRIDPEIFHISYHIYQRLANIRYHCNDDCKRITLEIAAINNLMYSLPLQEKRKNCTIVQIWCYILEESRIRKMKLEYIVDVLKYLFSIPISYKLINFRQKSGLLTYVEEQDTIIQFNMNYTDKEILDEPRILCHERLLSNSDINSVIENTNSIPALED